MEPDWTLTKVREGREQGGGVRGQCMKFGPKYRQHIWSNQLVIRLSLSTLLVVFCLSPNISFDSFRFRNYSDFNKLFVPVFNPSIIIDCAYSKHCRVPGMIHQPCSYDIFS